VVLLTVGLALAAGLPLGAVQDPPPVSSRPCRLTGRVASGDQPLPGVALTVRAGERIVAITSTDLDGQFSVPLAPGTYRLRAELTGFAAVDRDLTPGTPPCDLQTDLKLVLASRAPRDPSAPATAPAAPASATAPAGAARGATTPPQGQSGAAATAGRGGRGGRGGPPRFESLSVQQSDAAAAATTTASETTAQTSAAAADDPAARLLPPGFSTTAPVESIAVAGTMVEVDRNQMNERMQALGRGEFAIGDTVGQAGLIAGLLPELGRQGGPGGVPGAGGGRGAGGGGGGGRGGGGGLAGRLGGANRIQVNANYSMGGSLLDAAPYQLRDQVRPERDYLQQSFSTTFGGPVVIPRLYNGTQRTTFNFSYTAGRNGDLFDQYATVPSDAYRLGDFSASAVPIIDPLTGEPFSGNIIPPERISQAAAVLMGFIPAATLPGDTRNFRSTGTSLSVSDSYSLRITHSFTTPPAGRGGRGGAAGTAAAGRAGGAAPAAGTTGATGAATPGRAGGTAPAAGTTGAATPAGAGGARGGGQGARGGGAGRGGRGAPPVLNVTMNATINYRRNHNDRPSVFPLLSGSTEGGSWSVPVTVNVRYGRSTHAFNTSFSRTRSSTLNSFAFVRDVAGQAGIGGVSTDPFDWGVPSITFSGSGFTGIRDVTPSRRDDRSFTFGYSWRRTAGTHNWTAGGDYAQQWNDSQSDSNARGTFTFTGLYTAGGPNTVRGSGQDFADFLLGLPQQATRSYSLHPDNIVIPIQIRGRSFGLYLQDDWRWKPQWTITYGVRWDFIAPFVEANGHMVNLDANDDFTAVAPVMSGGTGLFSGEYPTALVRGDWNNVAPRIGAAWRATNRSVIRFGYGLSYNSGTYSSIARQLYQQPPFFLTGTSQGTLEAPLDLANPFANITGSTVTNTYGIDSDYRLGLIHQWSADYSRDVFRTWAVGATYFGTLGRDLDILRAPNRGPTGLRIEGVQAFTWQSSEGASYANGVTLRLQKRQTRGIAGSVNYTWSLARDNTTATGGGATVAQDDRNLDAEWAVSSFDRRHQLSSNVNIQMPWGPDRVWLTNGGWVAAIAGGWSMSANFSWSTGAPLTARCSSCAADIARGIGGTLRADYNGQPIQLDNPTIDEFFNTGAFSVPAPGTFGNSFRNMIIGPGSKLLNASFTRDVRLGGNRNVSIQVTANNLLNLVNYGGVDVNVNSPTFGQITSVRGMRTVRLNLRFRF
jgi:hypothetical protein